MGWEPLPVCVAYRWNAKKKTFKIQSLCVRFFGSLTVRCMRYTFYLQHFDYVPLYANPMYPLSILSGYWAKRFYVFFFFTMVLLVMYADLDSSSLYCANMACLDRCKFFIRFCILTWIFWFICTVKLIILFLKIVIRSNVNNDLVFRLNFCNMYVSNHTHYILIGSSNKLIVNIFLRQLKLIQTRFSQIVIKNDVYCIITS